MIIRRGSYRLGLEAASRFEGHACGLLSLSGCGRETSVVDEAGLSGGSTLRRPVARMNLLLEVPLLGELLIRLSRPNRPRTGLSQVRLLHSQLLLMRLHHLELLGQLMQNLLLLGVKVLRLLQAVKHLNLLLGEVVLRSLLHRLITRLESLGRYCIVALHWVRWWVRRIRWLKYEEKLIFLSKHMADASRNRQGRFLGRKTKIFRVTSLD